LPYFFILPAFALYLAIMAALIIASALVNGLSRYRTTFVSVLGWSSLGFVLANLLYAAIAILLVDKVELFSAAAMGPSIVGGIALIFVFPFVFSTAGLAGGIVLGLRRCRNDREAA
jgi:hypothetical protein